MSLFTSIVGSAYPPSPVSGITFVQQKVKTQADGSASVSAVFTTLITAGNSVLVQIAFDPSKATFVNPPTMNGGGAGVLTQGILNEAANNIWIYNYYIHGLSGETGVTFQLDTAVPVAVNASEWYGLAAAGPEDTDTETGAPDNLAFANVTPISLNNLCIASYATVGNNYASGPTNSWVRMTPANVAGIFLETAYKIQTSAAPADTSWGLNDTVDWSSIGCIFGH